MHSLSPRSIRVGSKLRSSFMKYAITVTVPFLFRTSFSKIIVPEFLFWPKTCDSFNAGICPKTVHRQTSVIDNLITWHSSHIKTPPLILTPQLQFRR